MPGPADLANAWQDAIKGVADSAKALVSDSAGAASEIAKPLQQQAVLLERVFQRQLEFERDVLSRIVEPVRVTLELSNKRRLYSKSSLRRSAPRPSRWASLPS